MNQMEMFAGEVSDRLAAGLHPRLGSVKGFGVEPDKIVVVSHLAAVWNEWYETWRRRGFAQIRDVWLSRAARLGERIRAKFAAAEMNGVFEGIDETGALILRESQGRIRAIAAGEVFF